MSLSEAFPSKISSTSFCTTSSTDVSTSTDCVGRPELVLNKVVTNVAPAQHPDTGKWWLTQTCTVYDETCNQYKEVCEGIYELTAKFAAGDTVPSFDGVQTAYTANESIEVIGGSTLPDDMLGFFLCVNGELCYVGSAPSAVVPNEVQIGGDQPAAGSDVELWISNGIAKTQSDDGLWTQNTPTGA